MEKPLLVENFLNRGKICASAKLPWSWKFFCLWKASLIIEKSLKVENVLDYGKISASG